MRPLLLLLATLLATLTASAQLPSYVPTDGLIAFYPFNGNAHDESGNGHDGIITGASFAEDRNGNADASIEFNGYPVPGTNRTQVGLDNHVYVPDFDDPFANGLSISLWALEFPTSESAFLQRRNNNNIDFNLELNTSNQIAAHLGFTAFSSQETMPSEQWTHLTLTYDEESIKLYKSGVLIEEQAASQSVNNFANELFIGKYIYYGGATHHFFFNGRQDDLGIWNRALTLEEIEALADLEPSSDPGDTSSHCAVITSSEAQADVVARIVVPITDGMAADAADVQLVMDGTPLPHWIGQTWTDSAEFFVRMTTLDSGTNTLTALFGEGYSHVNDGTAVFDVFDDFDGSSMDDNLWTSSIQSGASMTFSGGEMILNVTQTDNYVSLYTDEAFDLNDNWAFLTRCRTQDNRGHTCVSFGSGFDAPRLAAGGYAQDDGYGFGEGHHNDWGVQLGRNGQGLGASQWQGHFGTDEIDSDIHASWEGDRYQIRVDGELEVDIADVASLRTDGTYPFFIWLNAWDGNNRSMWVDYAAAFQQADISVSWQGANCVQGCTDATACNYSTSASEDDGSCTYADYGQDCDGNCGGGTRWFVDATANEAAATGDTLTPFATIQAALDMACPSDTVLIAPGTYVENVSSTAENVTIRGYAPSLPIDEVAANVIIDGNALGTALFISGDQTLLQDVTVQNGQSGYGAGLYLSAANGAIIQRCTIRDNVGTGDITAHGIALDANDCVIEDCHVTGNYGRKHTIHTSGSGNSIRNCHIVDNDAWETGGGIVVNGLDMLIENCLISGNNNGGVTTYRDQTIIDHCTISNNSGFGCFIWCFSNDADLFISNSIVSNNGDTEFKMVQNGIAMGTAHIRNSIVKGGVDYDWTSVYKVFDIDGTLNTLDPVLLSDYTLASTSSAIGTAGGNRYDFAGILGTPSSTLDLDYAGRPQPAGTDADLGAMEHPLGTPEPTFGCTDDTACNYDPAATDDDASCIAPTCDDPTACNYDADATCGGGACIPSGCMEEDACNYDPAAQCAGEACDYTCCPGPGCCDDPSQWDAALQQCNTAAPDTIVVTDTLLVPTPFCGAGTHWDPVTEMCIADGPGTVDENCTVMNLQELAEGYQVLLDHTADQDSIILAQQATIDALDAVCGCSAPVSYQGHDYEVVEIGGQCWFAENLQSDSYRNGDAIPVLANSDWDDTPNGSQAAFDSDEANVIEYGRLYNWHAIDDPRRLCPSGWHVPDDAEWQVLIDGIGAQGGLQLKASSGWTAGPNGTDAHGFDGRPAGKRSANGVFSSLGALATWWSATPNENGGDAHVKSLIDNSDEVYQQQGISRQQGRSIRCLKN